MAKKRKTITLTDQQDIWVSGKLAAGIYTNFSEAIRDLIRHALERDAALKEISQALIAGEASGEPEPFDFDAFRKRKIAEHS
jgi:antitoxin ParD1/3/4